MLDRNSVIVVVFWTFLLVLVGWLGVYLWRGDVTIDDTVVGTIIGAFLAGVFGILAAAYSISWNKKEAVRLEASAKEVTLHGIFTKLLDLNDVMQKNLRHFRILDQKTKVFFDSPQGRRAFTKPLESMKKHIQFSVHERTYLLREFGAEYFNEITDIQGVSESFSFLHERHTQIYYELMDEVFSRDSEREGYLRSGEIDTDSIRLMAMMDVDGGLSSLLHRSTKPVEEFLQKVIKLSNDNTTVKMEYKLTDTPSSADNDQRVEY